MVRSCSVRLLAILAMSLLVAMPPATHPAVAATHASSSTTVTGMITIGAGPTLWTRKLGSTTLEGYSVAVTWTGGIAGKGFAVGE
jgi:hypothetical protein